VLSKRKEDASYTKSEAGAARLHTILYGKKTGIDNAAVVKEQHHEQPYCATA
jgi:hypothetical protein